MENNITKLALLFGIIATMSLGTMNTVLADTSERTGVALGHIELVLRDSDGNIKQYVQTDNIVTLEGLDCLVDSLFGSTGTGTCSSALDFDVVAIGTGAAGGTGATALTGALGAGCIAGVDPGVVADTGGLTQAIQVEVVFGGGGQAAGDVNNAACEAIITEAGVFNTGNPTTTTDNMFATQGFGAITIGSTDTLTVTWDIDFT